MQNQIYYLLRDCMFFGMLIYRFHIASAGVLSIKAAQKVIKQNKKEERDGSEMGNTVTEMLLRGPPG